MSNMNPFVLQPVEDKNAPNHHFGLKSGSSNSNLQNIPTAKYFEDIIKIPRSSPLQELPSTMNILSPSVLPFSEKKKIFALHQHNSLAPTPAPTPNQAISKRNSDGVSSPLSTLHRKPLAFKRVMSSPNTFQHGGVGGGLFLSKDFGSDRSVRSDNNKENVLKKPSVVETTAAIAEPSAPNNVLITTPFRHKLPSERTGRTLESMRDRYDSARNTAGRLGVQGMFSEPPKRIQHGWTSGSNYASPRYTHLSGRRIFEESSRVSKYSRSAQQQPFFHESRSSAAAPPVEGKIFMRDLQTELNQLNRSREDEATMTTEPKKISSPDAVTKDYSTTAGSSPRGGDFCEVPTCPIIDEDDHNDESVTDDNFLNSSCAIIDEDDDHDSVADVYCDKAATTRNNNKVLNRSGLLGVSGDTGTSGTDSESSKALYMANPVVDSEYSESYDSRSSGDGSFSSPARAPYPVGDSEYSSHVSRSSGSVGDTTYSSPSIVHAAVPSVISVKSSFSSAESECSKALHLANPIYESDYSYESSETLSQNDNLVQDFMGPFNVLHDSDDLMSRDLMSSRDLMPLRDLMSQSQDSSQMMDSSQMLDNEMCLIGTDLSVVFRTHEGALPSAVKNAADFDDDDSIRVYRREKKVAFNENVVQLCEDEKIETDDGPPIVLYDERAGGVLSKRCTCTIS